MMVSNEFMSQQIDYRNPFVIPDEYQLAYEQERGRWLRRRLMWYAGVSLGFGLLMSLPAMLIKSDGVRMADLLTLLFSNAGAALVMILAWRCKPRAQTVLRIAFVFYVLASLWTIGYSYIKFLQNDSAFQIRPSDPPDAHPPRSHSDDPDFRPPASKPTSKPSIITGDLNRLDEPVDMKIAPGLLKANAGQFQNYVIHGALYFGMLLGFAFNHFIICLFIPWTVRESIRPAGIIAGAAMATAGIDVVLGLSPWWLFTLVILIMPFTFLPGTLVSWWRYSRFNQQFQLQFESGRYRAMQHELSSARAVHDANLPEPRSTGPVRLNYLYEPMRQIGGDLLMIYPPDPRATPKYVILFDVTGHGVAAALSVNRIVGEIERLLAENPDASATDLTHALNRYIHLTLAKHHLYVSALILKIDVEANQIECVNAGHPTAYHINCGARTTAPVESTAMLLGVVGADVFAVESTVIPFAHGDAVIGYTDGASEATDPDGRMLGLTGVRDAICQTIGRSVNPAEWPVIVSRLVVEHRLAPSQDDTIIFSLWRA